MPTPEEIDSILQECSSKLDHAAGLIRDLPLQPVKQNIRKIGRALVEICEIRMELFKLRPDLKPSGWDDPPTDEEFSRMFGRAILEAYELVESGRIEEAIQCFESFISLAPSEHFKEMAENEIRKLKRD